MFFVLVVFVADFVVVALYVCWYELYMLMNTVRLVLRAFIVVAT